MTSSPPSSDLSDPPSGESDAEDRLSTAGRLSRRSMDTPDHLAPPSKRRRTGHSSLVNFERAPSSQPGAVDDDPSLDDAISISSDGLSSAPGSPDDNEYSLREGVQTACLWRDCDFGVAQNNDDLVRHVQMLHCATGATKKKSYTCEWGECQRKTSNHPSGYALKAHMRSHTKEKPYYCLLPECDKSFTRSDALAKHMRTVHDPEQVRGTGGHNGANEATPVGKKSIKLKLINGNASSRQPSATVEPSTVIDEDGTPNSNDPSPANDNITYIPARHPLTNQPGFMIHYPPDISFTQYESEIPADHLMRLLRRQVHWAEKESEVLRREIEELEQLKREEWTLKEILLEGVLEETLAQAVKDDAFVETDPRVYDAMLADVQPAKQLQWSSTEHPGAAAPAWRRAQASAPVTNNGPVSHNTSNGDIIMHDSDADATNSKRSKRTRLRFPSDPPSKTTAANGNSGFDGSGDPYDNYLMERMAVFEQRQQQRRSQAQNHALSSSATSSAAQKAAEADAVGALLGMSGGGS